MAKRKVLVVEDVPELSHLLGMTLELDDRFVPAASARSGEEALAMAELHKPDAIVLDVSIDGVESGIDVLPDLRKLLPRGAHHRLHRARQSSAAGTRAVQRRLGLHRQGRGPAAAARLAR